MISVFEFIAYGFIADNHILALNYGGLVSYAYVLPPFIHMYWSIFIALH